MAINNGNSNDVTILLRNDYYVTSNIIPLSFYGDIWVREHIRRGGEK